MRKIMNQYLVKKYLEISVNEILKERDMCNVFNSEIYYENKLSNVLDNYGIDNIEVDLKKMYAVDVDSFILVRCFDNDNIDKFMYYFVDLSFFGKSMDQFSNVFRNYGDLNETFVELMKNGYCEMSNDKLNKYISIFSGRNLYIDMDDLFDKKYYLNDKAM